MWDGRTGTFLATLNGHVGAVYQVAWSSDSRLLVSASKDSTVKLWEMVSLKRCEGTAVPVVVGFFVFHVRLADAVAPC